MLKTKEKPAEKIFAAFQKSENLTDEQVKDKWLLINATLNEQFAIPEKKFSKLKALHLRKVKLSKMSSAHPGCPIFVLDLILLCRSIIRVLQEKKHE